MGTDWGADVFQMVDDGAEDGVDDDDSVDDDEEVDDDDDDDGGGKSGKSSSKKKGKSGKKSSFSNSIYSSQGSGSVATTRNEMSQEEEAKRAKRFQSKITKKSNEDMALSHAAQPASIGMKAGVAMEDVSDSSTASLVASYNTPSSSQQAIAVHRGKGPLRSAAAAAVAAVESPGAVGAAASASAGATKLPFRSVSSKARSGAGAGRDGRDSHNASRISQDEFFDEDDTNPLSMDAFNEMMDTLAMQPKKYGVIEDEVGGAGVSDGHGGMLPIDGFSAEISNKKTGLAGAFNSEKGSRHTQEDRCVLVPDVAELSGIEEIQPNKAKREQLHQYTVGCVFDGHSGWRCAQYLSQNFVPMLVGHEKFLDKQCDEALVQVCAAIDAKVILLDL
jgi:hypothetical protein